MTLQHANKSQQAFSSENTSTLHQAIPALESLHKAWSVRIERPKYDAFAPALTEGVNKIKKYYDATADCDAYTVVMCAYSPLPACSHHSRLLKILRLMIRASISSRTGRLGWLGRRSLIWRK